MRQITESAHFANDLGLDSLDTVEVVMAIEEVRFSPLLAQGQRVSNFAGRQRYTLPGQKGTRS